MVKGVAIKFKSYGETLPALFRAIRFDDEIKQHEKIVIKPNLANGSEKDSTKIGFIEQILKFCMENKNPGTEIFIAEGVENGDTIDVFSKLGYRRLAEKYGITLLDLNKTECEKIEDSGFLAFKHIMYPKVLLDSFLISVPHFRDDWETGIAASLDNMLGAFPARHYKSFLSPGKNKMRKHGIRHAIHDIVKCKIPDFSIIDASEKGYILAGQPLEMDRQAAKVANFEVKNLPHLKLIEDSLKDS